LGKSAILVQVVTGTIQEIVFLVPAGFKNKIPKIVCCLNEMLLSLHFPKVTIRNSAEGAGDYQQQSETGYHFLADV
jgi:hypothetical protein